MYDRELLVEKLKILLEALDRIPRRFTGISPTPTISTPATRE
ncbi:MAG: hypothetical protein U9R05_11450 [Chloroflexota bacterium]|nr:hypothetical protein [Chloroflexota bacterium]